MPTADRPISPEDFGRISLWESIAPDLDATGYANGDQFTNEEQVREYFSPETQHDMFGDDAHDPERLDKLADYVIEHRLHCDF